MENKISAAAPVTTPLEHISSIEQALKVPWHSWKQLRFYTLGA